jgi:hypothetical protein
MRVAAVWQHCFVLHAVTSPDPRKADCSDSLSTGGVENGVNAVPSGHKLRTS